ncbi:hypothetical protein TNCV_1606331 [Trichonephila clavipes]|nr:hypothetical protein TNCV_1606331 [Trichonephila clavipes]
MLPYSATRELLATDLVTLNHGQVTTTPPEPTPPSSDLHHINGSNTRAVGDEPRNLESRSSDEDDTSVGTPFPNCYTMPTRGL